MDESPGVREFRRTARGELAFDQEFETREGQPGASDADDEVGFGGEDLEGESGAVLRARGGGAVRVVREVCWSLR
jgi:hypothetical protein